MNKPKRYEDLTIADDFLFCKIMQDNPDICEELLEAILDKKVRIKHSEKQKTIDLSADSHSIRLDVYLEDDMDTVYDIEMQTTDSRNLPKRTRYYQGVIDLDILGKGADYYSLPGSYIIFICPFDVFGKGRHKYTFQNLCVEDATISLHDDTTKIFLCAGSKMADVSPKISAFLDYVAGHDTEDGFVKKIESRITEAKAHENWKGEYMTLYMRDEEMKRTGRKEGAESVVYTLISNGSISIREGAAVLGISVQELEKKMSERDSLVVI